MYFSLSLKFDLPSPTFTSFSKDAISLLLNSFKFLAEVVSIKRMLSENSTIPSSK